MGNISFSIILNKAGTAGAVLGFATAGFMFISQLTGSLEMPAVVTSIVSLLLWAARFVCCIWIMRHFMKRLSSAYASADNRDIFRFGVMTSLFSALLFSGISLANFLFISPEYFETQMNVLAQSYSMLDVNSAAMLDKVMDNFASLSFFSSLIYCTLYGTVLSAILSRNIPARDPFAGYTSRNDNQ